MKLPGKKSVLLMGLNLLLLVVLIAGATAPARAAEADVAMFYDELAAYGSWVDYGNYGPVWYPTQGITPNWRPYVDGRWVPSTDGWIFESSEPWAWATYHFGNWMPTTEYGWVWSPGSTWYPSTVAWRTSPETTAVESSYVGWAPIPPPDYVPEPAYYPTSGYEPGAPLTDLLTAPFWTFAQAASFLLGFDQPFVPAYSYYNCGCLSPFTYTPVLYPSTFFNNDFYYYPFAPRAFFAFGPAFPFVARVTNINVVNINNFARNANFNRMRNVLPPGRVFNQRPFIREAIPAQVRAGRGLQVQRVANVGQIGHRGLADPRVLPAPGNVPKLTHQIPKGVTPLAQPAARGGPRAVTAPRGGVAPRAVTTPRGEAGPRAVTTPKAAVAPHGVTAPRAPGEAPKVMTAPGREHLAPSRVPARELRTPSRPPTGEFVAPGRTPRATSRELRAPSRGTTMPPPATHTLTPQMNRQIRQYQRSPSTFRPSTPAPSFRAPSPAPSFRTPSPAPSFRAPAPAPRAMPSAPAPRAAPAPRPSAPAPAPHPAGPAPGGGGGQRHR